MRVHQEKNSSSALERDAFLMSICDNGILLICQTPLVNPSYSSRLFEMFKMLLYSTNQIECTARAIAVDVHKNVSVVKIGSAAKFTLPHHKSVWWRIHFIGSIQACWLIIL
jgi:hypothetical protein